MVMSLQWYRNNKLSKLYNMCACVCACVHVCMCVRAPTGGPCKVHGRKWDGQFHTQQMPAPVTHGDRWGTLIGSAHRHRAGWTHGGRGNEGGRGGWEGRTSGTSGAHKLAPHLLLQTIKTSMMGIASGLMITHTVLVAIYFFLSFFF